jgi:hypothetical protein
MTDTQTLAGALVAAQAAMPKLEKDAENPHYQHKFLSLPALIEATRPVLNEHGLALVQYPNRSAAGAPILTTLVLHGPTGERLEIETPLLVPETATMQNLGSAITYARRYAWQSILGIAAEEDDDGDAAKAPPRRSRRTPAAPSPHELISDAQRRRMFAIAGERGVGEEELRAIVLEVTGQESTKAIQTGQYDAVCRRLEAAQAVPGAGEADEDTRRRMRLLERLSKLLDVVEADPNMIVPQGFDSFESYARQMALTQYETPLEQLGVTELAQLVDDLNGRLVPFE